MSYWHYPRYVSVAEKMAKAEKKLKQLKKKNPGIRPIAIEGRTIARTWWGKAWNRNLESYADYENRIGRGRSYVRHGAVLDLQIDSGTVSAQVLGSRATPYSVTVEIKALDHKRWWAVKKASEGQLDSLHKLLAGKFPKALGEIFTTQGRGLFPSPKEIKFDCSCPDWASMCKHVAATLYGIGARLDEEPSLFFKLRQVEIKDLVSQAVEEKTEDLLRRARKKSARVLEVSDLSEVFGIDMDTSASSVKPKKRTARTARGTPKKNAAPSRRPIKTPVPAKGRSTATKPSFPEKGGKTLFEIVLESVKRHPEGVSLSQIKEETGFNEIQIRNIIYRAKKAGSVRNKARGIYCL